MPKRKIAIFIILAAGFLMASTDVDKLSLDADVNIVTPTDGQILTFDGPSGKWENKKAPTNFPIIVAKPSFVGKTTDIVSATLFTPLTAGDYRISQYAASNINGNVAITFQFSWTDEFASVSSGQQPIASLPAAANGQAYAYNTIVVHIAANNPITFTSCVSGPTCSGQVVNGTYDVFFTIEQLPAIQ